ncbi:rifin [Plasmodium falciparum IGH-CR14]|uniref:Rifin n=1 Tax=Plasmodium falciparum IGH-CR14 TaxID=580059 RepID=A0A0L1IE07_PLAFA|nr:rifin [Plasmodium falciparum IGH-CR14]KNG77752.1 rifin [Plasmodium falciparum IGH-CR14]
MVEEYNKNKPYITPHTSTTSSRVLSECDLYIPKYDNDADMKSVKEIFDRQTSQRFEEYEERIQEERQKCKEQCDKDIQEIIVKDKVQNSLAKKVEKGCLRCGCGLGGVAAGVGIIGPVVVKGLENAALLAATQAAKAEGLAAGKAAGDIAGADKFIAGLKEVFIINSLNETPLKSLISPQNYTEVSKISHAVFSEYKASKCVFGLARPEKPICSAVDSFGVAQGNGLVQSSAQDAITIGVQNILSDATEAAEIASKTAIEEATATLITKKTGEVNATYASCQTAIIASVVAILVIVLIMVIIYLILRYRRKKKMIKKQQYTKLLNK